MALPNSITSPVKEIRKIVAAISAGTLIQWYDFYLFGSLAAVIAPKFFPYSSPNLALLYTLAIFAAGFIARPIAPLVFGRSDRRHANAFPVILMGASTFAIGILPAYETIGPAAPLLLLLLRLAQGLALGAESEGLTTRIQPTAYLALLFGLAAILVARYALDPDRAVSIGKFETWGWRIPFLSSIVLLAISLYLRQKLERPLPAKQSPALKSNGKTRLLTLFGAGMGQAVVFYTGLFYVQSFLEKTCEIDSGQSKTTLLIAIALAAPFFLLFGGRNSRTGRKWIILGGMLLAILTWSFLFRQLLTISGTKGRTELTDQKEISSTIAFIGKSRDLTRNSTTYSHFADGTQVVKTTRDTVYADGRTSDKPMIVISKTLNTSDYWKMVAILFIIALQVTMVCSSLSPPDHLDSPFGGLAPFLSFLLTTIYTGNALAGLWYPIAITAVCLAIAYKNHRRVSNSHRKFAHVD